MIYVTHDQAEAMGMSDRIALLNAGKIQQLARPEDIYERPANRFVAEFIGRNNVVNGVLRKVSGISASIRFSDGSELDLDPGRRAEGVALNEGQAVAVCLRAETLRLVNHGGTFRGVVTDVEYNGSARLCLIRTAVGDLRVEAPGSVAQVQRGETVGVAVDPGAAHIVE